MLGVRTTYRSLSADSADARRTRFPRTAWRSAAGSLEPTETVSPTSPEWAAMPLSLLEEFNASRTGPLAGCERSADGGIRSGCQRRRLPVRLES